MNPPSLTSHSSPIDRYSNPQDQRRASPCLSPALAVLKETPSSSEREIRVVQEKEDAEKSVSVGQLGNRILAKEKTPASNQGIREFTPLDRAVIYQNPEKIEELLKSGYSLKQDREGGVPFILEAILGLACFSMELGADEEIHKNYLENAKSTVNIVFISLLVDHGVDIHARSRSGDTALIWAATFGHMELARFLIKKGIDVNIQNNNGETALTKAACAGHVKMVELLFSAGADPSIDAEGFDIFDLAFKC